VLIIQRESVRKRNDSENKAGKRLKAKKIGFRDKKENKAARKVDQYDT